MAFDDRLTMFFAAQDWATLQFSLSAFWNRVHVYDSLDYLFKDVSSWTFIISVSDVLDPLQYSFLNWFQIFDLRINGQTKKFLWILKKRKFVHDSNDSFSVTDLLKMRKRNQWNENLKQRRNPQAEAEKELCHEWYACDPSELFKNCKAKSVYGLTPTSKGW